ncbi:MAG: methyltransferase, partial [Cyanobacteria bacterium P01_C01_bin.70]
VLGEEISYRFANGFTIKTERLGKQDPWRILPLGSPQSSLMNHVLNFPEIARDQRVFEPFAGAGPLGFAALKVGASHVDFLDINPRAAAFHQENARLNQVFPSQFTSITGDIADFRPEHQYDLILANPPFVPTPEKIAGTLTSNGGPEGSRLVEQLLERLDTFLKPSGKVLIYVFQLVKNDRPLIMERLSPILNHRPVEITPAQARPSSFETYCEGYRELFPDSGQAIAQWRSRLVQQYGNDLALSHYVIDVGAKSDAPTSCVIRRNFAEKFGTSFFIAAGREEAIAFERASENAALST